VPLAAWLSNQGRQKIPFSWGHESGRSTDGKSPYGHVREVTRVSGLDLSCNVTTQQTAQAQNISPLEPHDLHLRLEGERTEGLFRIQYSIPANSERSQKGVSGVVLSSLDEREQG